MTGRAEWKKAQATKMTAHLSKFPIGEIFQQRALAYCAIPYQYQTKLVIENWIYHFARKVTTGMLNAFDSIKRTANNGTFDSKQTSLNE